MDDLQYFKINFSSRFTDFVLNLVINGWPSIQSSGNPLEMMEAVLNLVINGWPSIRLNWNDLSTNVRASFKPCYKWMTFNT